MEKTGLKINLQFFSVYDIIKNAALKGGAFMENNMTLIMDGFYVDGRTGESKQISKIISIIDPKSQTFKGIEILASDCNLNDHNKIISYIGENYKNPNLSLVAGSYQKTSIHYTEMVDQKQVIFGAFTYDMEQEQMIGREQSVQQGKLKRDWNRQVKQYNLILAEGDQKLYEILEAALLFAQKNPAWKAIQYSVEAMVVKSKLCVPMLCKRK